MKRMQTAYGLANWDFAAFVAFYPNSLPAYREHTATNGEPIRMFHGTADDYNPVVPCREYVARAAKAEK